MIESQTMRTENECQFSTEKKLEREGKKRLLFCCCGLEQERLGAEIDRLMAGRPPDAPLDWQLLGRFAYLKACLKETFRLFRESILMDHFPNDFVPTVYG